MDHAKQVSLDIPEKDRIAIINRNTSELWSRVSKLTGRLDAINNSVSGLSSQSAANTNSISLIPPPFAGVTSVSQTVPLGFAITGSPITAAGTLALSYAAGYGLPLTADTAKGVTAYGWGNYALAIGVTIQAYNANLAAISALPNAVGWLYNNGAGAFSYTTPPLAAHNILSVSHGDSNAGAVVAGDILFGNATPKWDRLSANALGTNKFLRSVSSGLPSWEQVVWGDLSGVPGTFPPTAHNILSASHGDTLADSVLDGDVLIGNVTPKWSRLAISVPAATYRNVFSIDNGETRPSWKVLFDAAAPSTVNANEAALAGTAIVAARRDHVHATPATYPATAHNLLSGTHGDTTLNAAVVGGLITGQAGPVWAYLAGNATATKKFLRTVSSGAASWEQVDWGDLSGTPASVSYWTRTGTELLPTTLGDTITVRDSGGLKKWIQTMPTDSGLYGLPFNVIQSCDTATDGTPELPVGWAADVNYYKGNYYCIFGQNSGKRNAGLFIRAMYQGHGIDIWSSQNDYKSRIDLRYAAYNDLIIRSDTYVGATPKTLITVNANSGDTYFKGNIGIGVASPTVMLDAVGTNGLFLCQNSSTTTTIKFGEWGIRHYDTTQLPFYAIYPSSSSTLNILALGGGTALGNAATDIRFYCAANNTTGTGTLIGSFGITGLVMNTGYVDTKTYYYINGNKIMSIDGAGNFLAGTGASNQSSGSYNVYIGYNAGSGTGSYNLALGYVAGGALTSGFANVAMGCQAMAANQAGTGLVCIGYQAGMAINVNYGLYIGYMAGFQATGAQNTCIGRASGALLTSSIGNTFIGDIAGYSMTGQYNVAIGIQSGYVFGSGDYNTFVGGFAGYGDVGSTGTSNTCIGYAAGYLLKGTSNTCIGYEAGYLLNSSYNIMIGSQAGGGASGGGHSTVVGMYSGYYSTGAYTTTFGYEAGYNLTSGTYNTAIGPFAQHSAQGATACVMLGYAAGYYETGSSKLFIDNATRASEADGRLKALVYGLFDASPANQIFRINGALQLSNGTVGLINTSFSAAQDLQITCGSQKTLVLNNPTYKDVFFPQGTPKATGAGNPTKVTWVGNVNGYSYGVNDVYDLDPQEFPHDGLESGTCTVHIHFIARTLVNAIRTVKYQLEYAYGDVSSDITTTTTISAEQSIPANTPVGHHYLLNIGTFTSAHIASMMAGLLKRIASSGTEPADDPVVLGLHYHYQIDTPGGSRQITTK